MRERPFSFIQAVPIVPAGYRPHGGDTPTESTCDGGADGLGETRRRERDDTDGAEAVEAEIQFRRQRRTHGRSLLKGIMPYSL